MENEWKNINELRETSNELSGGFYTAHFTEKHGLTDKAQGMTYGLFRRFFWVPEFVEVSLNGQGGIMWRYAEEPIFTGERELMTPCGKITICNMGEFGGYLETPNQSFLGNFIDFFECGGRIYTIDSNAHFTVAHVNIYCVSPELDKLTPVEGMSDYCNAYLMSFYINNNTLYTLVSEIGEYSRIRHKTQIVGKSFLYEIVDGAVVMTHIFDRIFRHVTNMVINDGKMILGLDKNVLVFDLNGNEKKIYTQLSVKAEKNILWAKCWL